jgi:DNA modification methylase
MNTSSPLLKAPPICSTVLMLAIDAIFPDPTNPRAHSKRQIAQIARSIETFGFNVPVLIDRNQQVIAGHGRLEACRLLGWTEVPTIQLDHLSPAQAKAYMIADNRLTENSTWDDKLLAQSLKELAVLDLDFTLDVIGFDMGEIDFRIESLDAGSEDDPGDTLPTPSQTSATVPGDLWLAGPHRLLCANSLEADSYVRLMAGHQATVVFEDPPYNVKIDGHVGGKGAIKHREFAMASGEMSSAEFTSFLTTAFMHAARHSKNGSVHFLCMDWRHVGEITAAGQVAYTELKNICVWVKNVGGMGSLYRSRHELIFVFKNGTAPHINNVELGRHGRYRTNVWEYPGISTMRRSGEEGDLLAMHPTVKPIRLVADAILDCSNRGDIVLDAFLGSGTTLMAAQRVGRVCYGLEIDPQYVDTAIRRWQADTGLDAIHAESGMTFSAREAIASVAASRATATSVIHVVDREVQHELA